MEIELKYLFQANEDKQRIFLDQQLLQLKRSCSHKILQMRAIYMDTEQEDLRKKKIAFRVRYENDELFATIKWGGDVSEGLHVRGELNVPVEENFLEKPTLEIFQGNEIYDEFLSDFNQKKLQPIMKMEFTRNEFYIDSGTLICQIALDEGSILTAKGEGKICELELEYCEGNQQEMMALGTRLAKEYHLIPSNKSKYQLGLEATGEKTSL